MTRNEVQSKAVEALVNNGGGLVCLEVGCGKGKVAVDYLNTLEGELKGLFVAPRTGLINSFKVEADKWNLNNTIAIDYTTMQAACKYTKDVLNSYDFILADEAHCITSPEFSKIIKLTPGILHIGLTGTPGLDDEEKKQFYNEYLPIVYEFYDAVESGFINKTRYIIYDHELDNNYQYTITTKKSSWSKGELAQYEYLDGTINSSYDKIKEYYFEEIKRNTLRYLEEGLINATDKAFLKELVSRDLSYYYELMQERWNKKDMSYNLYQIVKAIKPSTNYAKLGLNAIRLVNESGVPEKVKSLIFRYNWALKQRKNMLWSLASTRDIATKIKQLILEDENNKVLIFSESTEQINSLTNHTIHSKTADTPAKSKKLNKERLSQFNEGTSREVGSVKMMQLGLNLKGANYAIFESYNSSSTGGKQSQGRLQRLEKWDLATVILIKVKNTQCEKWFESFTSLFDLTDSEYVTSIDELKEVL